MLVNVFGVLTVDVVVWHCWTRMSNYSLHRCLIHGEKLKSTCFQKVTRNSPKKKETKIVDKRVHVPTQQRQCFCLVFLFYCKHISVCLFLNWVINFVSILQFNINTMKQVDVVLSVLFILAILFFFFDIWYHDIIIFFIACKIISKTSQRIHTYGSGVKK